MLHEVLLALSGHPSPLFAKASQGSAADDFPLLSPSEAALLKSIGTLSELHRKLKQHLGSIASQHESVICRAVAASIQQVHLGRFQKHILQVEERILKKDASLVGAYEIVPLASVVAEFDGWPRLMHWYWQVASFMSDPTGKNGKCTSARLIDKLRLSSHTGYPDVENAATELTRVAEMSWLRQLTSWVVYGKLPTYGAKDFFIKIDGSEERKYAKDKALLPGYVTPSTAASILFIGKSLHQVAEHQRLNRTASTSAQPLSSDGDLASAHLQHLSSLALPIVATQLSRSIAEIRMSLSQNVLQHLLPLSDTIRLLTSLRQFFLLDRGDFAMALIHEADDRVQSRQQSMGKLLAQDPVKALRGLSIKDAELSQTLRQVWRSLAARDEDGEDEVLEYGQSHISLVNPKAVTSRPSTADSIGENIPEVSPVSFNNLLFPNPTELSLRVLPPMDLFLSARDMQTYASISSYLLSIRRGHQRLSELWKQTPARRTTHAARTQHNSYRPKGTQRAAATRGVWASCSAAMFLLSETAAFFEGEIIRGSCDHFQQWVETSAPDVRDPTIGIPLGQTDKHAQRDPETLAFGHRTFLASLTYALLLTDLPYTKEMQSLLGNIDSLVAYFVRLLSIQEKIDGEEEATGEPSAHLIDEEQKLSIELERARNKVDHDLRSIVHRLRQLDRERIGSTRYLDLRAVDRGDYETWKGGGVDRLLMKLEFGRMIDEDYAIIRGAIV
ncbi:Putative gamma-tubulin complex component protein [Septoria linicola]|uniref:Spindle pole body component n=1 Tax=Septoria linicola TaxID=215465 RepID=A0A9Q9EPT6_9PEZI|nr:putative gamma-tubulin complex component protein [Septoria linicola]USW56853.1 Putative gamma-tubulin complex component protein [Septoria linicola]